MSSHPVREMSASVKQRLLNLAKERGEDFNFLLSLYAAERFLFRLGQSVHANEFVLKGAMLFHLASGRMRYRPTRDIDLLGRGTPDLARLEGIFRAICVIPVGDDGLVFIESSVEARRIQEGAAYKGVRVIFGARLGSARIPMQVDVGFGDVIERPAKFEILQALLDFPPARLSVNPWEVVVAEKFQAMADLGMANSRMKDYFDLRYLAATVDFDGARLARAIKATFDGRSMDIPTETPVGLSGDFVNSAVKIAQWRAFLRRLRVDDKNDPLEGVVGKVGDFLMPLIETLSSGKPFKKKWRAGGPWR